MSKETEELKEQVKLLESGVERLEEKMRDIEETEKIKRMLKDQEKGTFKYVLDVLKVIAAIVLLLTAGNKFIDTPWIESLVK